MLLLINIFFLNIKEKFGITPLAKFSNQQKVLVFEIQNLS